MTAIPYRAETSSLVYSTREVRELMAAARAVADPTDQLALVTALRSPLFGCGDDDLFEYRVDHSGAWSLLAPAPESIDPAQPVVAALAYLRDLHRDVAVAHPVECWRAWPPTMLVRARLRGRPAPRPVATVALRHRPSARVEQTEGGTLRQYLDWARRGVGERARSRDRAARDRRLPCGS